MRIDAHRHFSTRSGSARRPAQQSCLHSTGQRGPRRPRRRALAMDAAALPPDKLDSDRPQCHVMARRGWINDPNGPIFFKGKYHLFYQHLPTGCEWDWGLVWGHAVSSDLIHWEHLPPALKPSPGCPDADGCFSGCSVLDTDGTPTILYTGVRLRSNQDCGPLPPTDCDLQLPFIETQMLARAASKEDEKLATWTKAETPFIPLPPKNVPLTGWRDPFVVRRGTNGQDWIILMGAGLKGRGGTTLVYRAESLTAEWEYSHFLCSGDATYGEMWECPLLWDVKAAPDAGALLQSGGSGAGFVREVSTAGSDGLRDEDMTALAVQNGSYIFAQPAGELERSVQYSTPVAFTPPAAARSERSHSHFFCISPDAPTNPVLYWLGGFDEERITFDLPNALGPFRLDLGDTIYAPNIFEDPRGRCVLWAWVQERRTVGKYDFSGCMATPRILLRLNDRLVQQPLPELLELRSERCVEWEASALPANTAVPLEGVNGHMLDVEVVFERGASAVSGIVLESWNASQGATVVLFDWSNSRLEVITEGMDDSMQFSISTPAKRLYGQLDPPQTSTVALRMILDHSLLEVFTGTGQVLTTRVSRGTPPASAPNNGISLVSWGGNGVVKSLAAWELRSIWDKPQVAAKPRTAVLSGIVGKLEALSVAKQEGPRVEVREPAMNV